MEGLRIRPVSEADVEALVFAAGGRRAHEKQDTRGKRGADFRLAEALIEHKGLDEEGFEKSERQGNLAALFREEMPDRPVIVLDPKLLSVERQRKYANLVEAPVYGAIRSAKDQLVKSRDEHGDAGAAIIFIINNGYTALDHRELCQLAVKRARQYPEVDGIVVAGCYNYGDGFDAFILPLIDYFPINLERPFVSYGKFRASWNDMAEGLVTEMMFAESAASLTKGPVVDLQFTLDGVTYVRPAPPMGVESTIFKRGRPRLNSTGLEVSPRVARTFPNLSRHDWESIRGRLYDGYVLGDRYEDWLRERGEATEGADPLQPLVPINVTCGAWESWCAENEWEEGFASLAQYANDRFQAAVVATIDGRRSYDEVSVYPARFIVALTEEIGQDRANDVSHILEVHDGPGRETAVRELVSNARIFHEHAIRLAAAYAVREGIECVLTRKDRTYA